MKSILYINISFFMLRLSSSSPFILKSCFSISILILFRKVVIVSIFPKVSDWFFVTSRRIESSLFLISLIASKISTCVLTIVSMSDNIKKKHYILKKSFQNSFLSLYWEYIEFSPVKYRATHDPKRKPLYIKNLFRFLVLQSSIISLNISSDL